MKSLLMSVLVCSLVFLGGIQCFANDEPADVGVNYLIWGIFLEENVNDQGLVDYANIKAKPDLLNFFIKHIANFDISQLSDNEKKAFWINAYNALTIQAVIEEYPVKSVRDLNSGYVWKVQRTVAQGHYNLEDIRNVILRRRLGDPRVLFVLNNASLGSPKLLRKPILPETLDVQLDEAARNFINSTERVRIDKENNVFYYSEFLDWYQKDFLRKTNSVRDFIRMYLNFSDRKYLNSHELTQETLPYNWNLNAQ